MLNSFILLNVMDGHYSNGLSTLSGQLSNCFNLPHGGVVLNVSWIAAGVRASVDVYRVLAVVRDESGAIGHVAVDSDGLVTNTNAIWIDPVIAGTNGRTGGPQFVTRATHSGRNLNLALDSTGSFRLNSVCCIQFFLQNLNLLLLQSHRLLQLIDSITPLQQANSFLLSTQQLHQLVQLPILKKHWTIWLKFIRNVRSVATSLQWITGNDATSTQNQKIISLLPDTSDWTWLLSAHGILQLRHLWTQLSLTMRGDRVEIKFPPMAIGQT